MDQWLIASVDWILANDRNYEQNLWGSVSNAARFRRRCCAVVRCLVNDADYAISAIAGNIMCNLRIGSELYLAILTQLFLRYTVLHRIPYKCRAVKKGRIWCPSVGHYCQGTRPLILSKALCITSREHANAPTKLWNKRGIYDMILGCSLRCRRSHWSHGHVGHVGTCTTLSSMLGKTMVWDVNTLLAVSSYDCYLSLMP